MLDWRKEISKKNLYRFIKRSHKLEKNSIKKKKFNFF